MNKNGDSLYPNNSLKIHDVPESNATVPESKTIKTHATLPTSFDLRSYNSYNYVTPIIDQGSCGACYAFATIACAENAFNWVNNAYANNRKSFSQNFLKQCERTVSP
ncbi:MAG TPA: hypothetical protein DCO75_04325, partial [Fibrobacteres bacterium]|nr:hypothetical protein [Fibrobacterota bacterium]